MWLFFIGILLGIGIYWAIAIILVKRVLNRYIDGYIENEDYPPILKSSKLAKDNYQ